MRPYRAPNTPLLPILAFTLALIASAMPASAQTFSNTAPIAMPTSTTDGRATLYPSPITVSGGPTSIGYVSVTLRGFSHDWAADAHVLLVAPSGQKIMLMANANGSGDAANDTLTFIPDSTATLPYADTNVVSGEYACSVYFAPFALPDPAPFGPYTASLNPLLGANANGTWRLYVRDYVPNVDNGTFAGGWSITFNQTPPPRPATTAFTYQGRVQLNGTPVSGAANTRFTLLNNPVALASVSQVGPVVTRSFEGIEAGLISTSLDFGTAIDTSQALWLNIEVESPPGSGFVTLSPRQPITPTPQARVAQVAQAASIAPWSGLTGQPAVSTSAIGSGWQLLFNNSANTTFRGGMRLADSGFFEVTNNAAVASPNFARLSGTGVWTTVSDLRLKTDISTAEGNLAAALKLRPVNFRWKADGTEDFGLIAQEVRTVLPRLVTGDEHKDSLTVNYSQLSAVAIGAIQEQQGQIESLQAQNADLKARLEKLERAMLGQVRR